MPFQAVTTQRLYERVAEQIADLIVRGEVRAGERLPPERDLAAKLGVSRPTVREAMIALELAGLVEVRVGAGTVVLDRRDGAARLAPLGDAGTGPIELIGARLLFEPPVAAAAARHATSAQRAAIQAALDEMAQAQDTPTHREADRAFHRRIAEATGNEVVVGVIDGLWREMFSPLFERLSRLTGMFPFTHPATLDEHRRVAMAIAAGDPDAAAAAMTDHLLHVERILSGLAPSHVPAPAGDRR